MRQKKGIGFSSIILIVIAIIGCFLIITILAKFLGILTDPNAVEEGMGCRVAIMATARIKSATQGILTGEKLLEACKTIEKEIPMRTSYPKTGKAFKADPGAFHEAVVYDITEIVSNAWWVTGEGDRAEYLLDEIYSAFTGKNQCFIPYAIKIKTPSALKGKTLHAITEAQLFLSMKKMTRSEATGVQGDMRDILTYITLEGKGSGLFLKTNEGGKLSSGSGKGEVIIFKDGGADAIYGVTVGFSKKDMISKLLDSIFANVPNEINKEASFIYIAPYDEVAKLCTVSN